MGVPFGFSVADIAKAIELSKEIYKRCHNEDQGANIKYQQFISDIRILGDSLERLQGVIRRYERQYPPRERHMGAQDVNAVENLWPRLTGDFHQTLQECDSLLSRHGYLRSGRNNISSNLRWWLSAEGPVDNLIARLKFHITKVEFYTRPSEFDSIMRNGNEIQQLRRQIARQGVQLGILLRDAQAEQSQNLSANVLSDELKERLEFEFQTNSPSWFVEGSEWPLKEAFEALAFHLGTGIVEYDQTPDLGRVPRVPMLSQYIGLAKSIWILEEIKRSHPQVAGSDSIWADRMREFEDDIRAQLHRFEAGELEKPAVEELLELPNSYFSISSGGEKDPNPLNAGEAGPLEEKILEIQLPSNSSNRESTLLVFRENETEDFRLVTSTKQADTLVTQYDREVELNMARNRLAPAYGNPSPDSSPRHNLLLYNERGRKAKELVFLNHEDTKMLQQALTGYRVHHEMPIALWRINGSKRSGDSGEGILQLWQYKPLPPLSTTTSSEFSGRNSLVESPRSPLTKFSGTRRSDSLGTSQGGRSYSLATSLATESNGSHESRRTSSAVSGGTMLSRSSVMSPVQDTHSDDLVGVELLKPELPVLIILTLCNQRYSFVHLTLNASIHVEPSSCGCRIPKRKCKKVVLESNESKGNFTIRKFIADEEGVRGLESWDLSVFRFPRPEKWKNTTVNEKVKTLELQFTGEEEKNEFLEELTLLENVRTVDQNDYEKSFRDKKKRARV